MLATSKGCSAASVRTSEIGRDIVLITWVGGGAACQPADSAEAAYRAVARALQDRGCVPVQERVFGDVRLARAVAAARARALAAAGGSWPVPATFVEGSPVERQGIAGIQVVGVRGRARVVAAGDRVYGMLVENENARVLGLSDVGRRRAGRLAPGPEEDAGATIDAAEQLLAREGFSFRDVGRTWFYLRDIQNWYGPFNAVRNLAFRRMGLVGPNGSGEIPASTGIEGRNARGGWCTLDLLALQPRNGGQLKMTRLHSRKQNEATEYGSSFARAMEVVLDDARYIFVSGTASIDDRGASVHEGDFEAQTLFTLEAVQSLLGGAGTSLADVCQATAFLNNPCDGRSFDRIVERSGLRCVPLVTTVADVCRPELLFEIDATAVVPLRRGAAR